MTNEEKFREVFGITNKKIIMKDACQSVEKCNGVDCSVCPFDDTDQEIANWWNREYQEPKEETIDYRKKKQTLSESVAEWDHEVEKRGYVN